MHELGHRLQQAMTKENSFTYLTQKMSVQQGNVASVTGNAGNGDTPDYFDPS